VGPKTHPKLIDQNSVKYDGSPYETNTPSSNTKASSSNTTTTDKAQIKECSDFPFKYGCKNPKIGEIRAKLIGDGKDVFDGELLDALMELTGIWPRETKVITQDIYNKIIQK
jgi:hypothetical protein